MPPWVIEKTYEESVKESRLLYPSFPASRNKLLLGNNLSRIFALLGVIDSCNLEANG